MSQLDSDYIDLATKILDHGDKRETRNATTLSIFNANIEFDLSKGEFPLLTTRQIFYKGVVGEFKSFIENASTLTRFHHNGCKFWDKWADKEGHLKLDYPPREQLDYIIDLLNNDPMSRRMVIDLWNPDNIGKLSLDCCHYSYQFYARNGYLDMKWIQRSVDVAVGMPSDFVLAALYTITMANEVGLLPGKVFMTFGDTHIYLDHVWDLTKMTKLSTTAAPTYKLTAGIKNFKVDDLVVSNYTYQPARKFTLHG